MSKYQTPCRYDFVGSFLRPQEVKQAKADYAEGKISEEEKDRIIDAAIADVVKKQQMMKGEFLDVIFDCPCFGLLGLMTALPTTSEFITYDAVYLPKNHFIKQETLSTEDYLAYFFPFDKISFVKKGQESMWNTDNREMFAVIMTLQDKPQTVLMSFQKEYGEPYEWITPALSPPLPVHSVSPFFQLFVFTPTSLKCVAFTA